MARTGRFGVSGSVNLHISTPRLDGPKPLPFVEAI